MKKHFTSSLDEHDRIKINDFFQVGTYQNIFAVGDCVDLPEEKMAERAIVHSDLVLKHLKRLLYGKSLQKKLSYKSPNKPPAYILSLGPHNALISAYGKFLGASRNIARLKKLYLVGAVEKLRGNNFVKQPEKKMLGESKGGYSKRRMTNVGQEVTTLNDSILIIGGTTATGSKVVLTLLDQLTKEVILAEPPLQGTKVANFIQKGAIIREYNIDSPESVETIYKNVDVVCLTLTFDMFPLLDRLIAPLQNLKDKIKMIILSIRGGIFSENRDTNLGKLCLEVENKIKSLNVPYTIIRHALEYEYITYFNNTLIQIRGVGTIPVKALNWVSAQDIATCIVNSIYKHNIYNGKTFELTSTKALELEDVSDCLSNSVRKVIPVVVIDEEVFRDTIKSFGYNDEKCDTLIAEYQHYQNFNTTNDILNLLEKDPEEFQSWSDKNAHEFVEF